ncbi:BLUF domain-containing protein [Acidithrix ferrooxidans]|uniref:Blue light-and temperature-regulated antirepressor YcgF n=1 Tax=Acidithrix ferrooxidans TaxID=1280514 RepID=A0A0D8HCX1_9ACTN|nr:BLUF domain-containing protein [Acidithrix ferrooxidans]KJF15739.1 blue light- and temperature-regulated antirepressor YcgF [Acidithrix ferrooxidans]
MNRLIYCSQATHGLLPEELVSLLEIARRNNKQRGLSGMLLYSSQSFLQLIEGNEVQLEVTYRAIQRDKRHTNLRLLINHAVSERMFPDWTMGFEDVNDEQLALELEGFTPAIEYPLVNSNLVTNSVIAETLLRLYSKNRER